MDMLVLMERLAEGGVTTVRKVDDDRMTEHRKAWWSSSVADRLARTHFSARTEHDRRVP